MKKNSLILILILLVFTAVGAYAFLKPKSENKMMVEETEITSDEAMMADEATDAVGSGKYVVYDPDALVMSKGRKRVLFFYANWCPTCRPADADFRENENKLPADLTLIRVNYNDDQADDMEEALADKYGVTYQHTYVQIDNNGEVVKKWNGGQLTELLANIK